MKASSISCSKFVSCFSPPRPLAARFRCKRACILTACLRSEIARVLVRRILGGGGIRNASCPEPFGRHAAISVCAGAVAVPGVSQLLESRFHPKSDAGLGFRTCSVQIRTEHMSIWRVFWDEKQSRSHLRKIFPPMPGARNTPTRHISSATPRQPHWLISPTVESDFFACLNTSYLLCRKEGSAIRPNLSTHLLRAHVRL